MMSVTEAMFELSHIKRRDDRGSGLDTHSRHGSSSYSQAMLRCTRLFPGPLASLSAHMQSILLAAVGVTFQKCKSDHIAPCTTL